jgi:hypothetical protein
MPGARVRYPTMAEDMVRGIPGGVTQLQLSDTMIAEVADYLATLK